MLHITSLMDTFFKVENLYEHTCLQCTFVGGTEKKLNIVNAPQVLVLHLARFTTAAEKIDTFVEFMTVLATEHIRDRNGLRMRYRLVGIIRYTGPSIQFGHYISYVLINGSWYEANDRILTHVSWQTVRRLKVYMLFYERL